VGEAYTCPPKNNNKIKDIIGISYLFLRNDRFICIGFVYGVVWPDPDERALLLLV
jgi:hypothetical protein